MPASSQDDNTDYGGSGEQDEVCCAQRCSGTRSGCLGFFGGFERPVYGVEYGLRLLNVGLSTLQPGYRFAHDVVPFSFDNLACEATF
jgi:hypothetical protein